jgi:crotonobetainyl-CoA:carnitine CoA-transferase CaiB-like acyl-CoA transferase
MENVEPVMNQVPDLGQQTDAILDELGFDAETIASWRREKII